MAVWLRGTDTMCGIAGIWQRSGQPIDPALLRKMSHSIAHRGPDGADQVMIDSRSGFDPIHLDSDTGAGRREHDVGLVHRRLAIIDVAGGHQPMPTEDG